jgi:hypothetical protein
MASTQQASGTVDGLDQFTTIIKTIIDKAWGATWGTFTNEWPVGNDPTTLPLPQITYELFHRVPSKSMKSIKPRLMETIPDPDVPNGTIDVYRQWFDCLVDFGIWHKTNMEAEALKQKFEDFMLAYSGYFKQQGVSELLFVAEMQPSVSTKWRQDIPHRALRYLVRIERVTPVRSTTISELFTNVVVHNPQQTGGTVITEYPVNQAIDPFLQIYNRNYPNSPTK